MKTISYYANITFAIISLAFLLPLFYQYIFIKPIDKTHVFHSIVLNSFVYTETIPYKKQAQKTEDHHDTIVYKDENEDFYTRIEFEDSLPFVYYRNAEARGKLPFIYNNTAYSRQDIEKERRVIELLSRNLFDKNTRERIYPLFEAKIIQVALTFPDHRIRFTENSVEFISADTNSVLAKKSQYFTGVLKQHGVQFPISLVAGNFTTFKPFEFGILIVDKNNTVFHLKQYNNMAQVQKLPFPSTHKIRHIVISENRHNYT